jgi:hypothetical protein
MNLPERKVLSKDNEDRETFFLRVKGKRSLRAKIIAVYFIKDGENSWNNFTAVNYECSFIF